MDESTKRRLELFIWKADKLSNKTFIKHLREQGGIEHTLTLSDEEGIYSKHTGPDADAIEAAAALYRLFTEKVNPTSFPAMAKLLDNPDISETWKAGFTRVRKDVNDLLDEPIPFLTDGKAFTHRYVVDIFLNGGIFHTEQGKVEVYQEWEADPLGYPEMEFVFITAIAAVMNAIFYLADLCRKELAMEPQGKES